MPRLPVSCFIIAQDEADRIARTIRSVRALVDEVVVVDSGSTDGTQDIARAEGVRVIVNAWPGFGQQKRFAEAQCRNDWLLNLDADEVVSSELADELAVFLASGSPRHAVYGIDILDVYSGQERPRIWARDYHALRLYDRTRARFADSTLFDAVDPGSEPVGHLKGAVYHFSMRSFDDFIRKADARAAYNAEHAKPKPRWVLTLRLITEFPIAFFKLYFGRRHFTGGVAGFQVAMIGAFYRFVRIVRMLERCGSPAPYARQRIGSNVCPPA